MNPKNYLSSAFENWFSDYLTAASKKHAKRIAKRKVRLEGKRQAQVYQSGE